MDFFSNQPNEIFISPEIDNIDLPFLNLDLTLNNNDFESSLIKLSPKNVKFNIKPNIHSKSHKMQLINCKIVNISKYFIFLSINNN